MAEVCQDGQHEIEETNDHPPDWPVKGWYVRCRKCPAEWERAE